MRGLTIGLILLAILFAAASGASRAGELDQSLPGFSCRAAEIFGGQHRTGAAIDLSPGNPNPLRFFRLREDGASGIDLIAPLSSSFLAEYAKVLPNWPYRMPFQFYWSTEDDFVAWIDYRIWLWRGDSIVAGGRPRFEHIEHNLTGYVYSLDDVVPEHIGNTARLAGDTVRRHLLEFNLRSGIFRRLPISVGPHPFAGLAWTSDDVFLRVRHHIVVDNRYLDLFDSKTQQWTEFSPQKLPLEAKLLLFRENPRTKSPEAIISWRDRANVDHVGTITRGADAPKPLASGQFAHVHVSPDRTQVFGVTDSAGSFRRIKGEPYAPNVAFWLGKFESLSGIKKFYLQENAQYAFIKVNYPTARAEISVLRRSGDSVQSVGTICSTQ